jgi:hypothetical protein
VALGLKIFNAWKIGLPYHHQSAAGIHSGFYHFSCLVFAHYLPLLPVTYPFKPTGHHKSTVPAHNYIIITVAVNAPSATRNASLPAAPGIRLRNRRHDGMGYAYFSQKQPLEAARTKFYTKTDRQMTDGLTKE